MRKGMSHESSERTVMDDGDVKGIVEERGMRAQEYVFDYC